MCGVACSQSPPLTESLSFAPRQGQTVTLLSEAEAIEAIITDTTDGYFEKVSTAEMSILLKRPLGSLPDRDQLLRDYKALLQSDVSAFSTEEAAKIVEVFNYVSRICDSVNPDIFPSKLRLIKLAGVSYGSSTYYTRENCIAIPANVLGKDWNHHDFVATMFHELFHVWSRYNPERRGELYRLIGFETLPYDRLLMPDTLRRLLLHNPDGVNFAQKMNLRLREGANRDVVPVIRADHYGYKKGRSAFFSYLKFDLYYIESTPAGAWRLLTREDGVSTLHPSDDMDDFFRQIRDNTNYIIHPDEVLADNFSLLMLSIEAPDKIARLSPEGLQLLGAMRQTLSR
ncbi:MAG: hypothetical protein ACK4NS_07120 [Saprospiraceae bacterium]